MTQPQEPSLGDLVVEDLERQLGEPDPRYARKCRELAVLRAQYSQLMSFVRSKKDVLGLTEVDESGSSLDSSSKPVETDAPSAKAETNGKAVPKETPKSVG